MSSLPQRKKSPEEIAKLRESFGLPVPPAGEQVPPEVILHEPDREPDVPLLIQKAEPRPDAPLAPLPLPDPNRAKQVRPIRRNERVEELPSEQTQPVVAPTGAVKLQSQPAEPKVVKSLRKSEQVPILPPQAPLPPPDSKLPIQRRTQRELNEFRRKEALAVQMAQAQAPKLAAHLALIIPGYLLMVAGALSFYYYELAIEVTASCVVAGLLIAGFILWKKPLSRHHGAFISAMALFVVVFGALHYFPQLRHGS